MTIPSEDPTLLDKAETQRSGQAPSQDDAVDRRVLEIVARSLDRSPADVTLQSRLWVDLDAESLDLLDIVYGLERAFQVRMPRLNLLQRASDLFGEDVILKGGVVTEVGMEIVRRSMPEIPSAWIRPKMRVHEFRQIITVESLARIVHRCREAACRLRCARCGGSAGDLPDSPMTMACAACGEPMELPSGEQLLVEDLRRIAAELHLPTIDASALSDQRAESDSETSRT